MRFDGDFFDLNATQSGAGFFAPFAAQELGLPELVDAPAIDGHQALRRRRPDYTQLRAGDPLRRGLLAWFACHDNGTAPRELAGVKTAAPVVLQDREQASHGRAPGLYALRSRKTAEDDTAATLLDELVLPSGGSPTGTVAFWCNAFFNGNQGSDNAFRHIVRIGKSDTRLGVSVGLNTFGEPWVRVVDFSSEDVFTGVVASGSPRWEVPGWHHLAVTSDGSSARIFVDGVETNLAVDVGTNGGRWTDIVESQHLNVLQKPEGLAAEIEGDYAINDVGVWNRALTESEVRRLARDPDSIYSTRFLSLVNDGTRKIVRTITEQEQVAEALVRVLAAGGAALVQVVSELAQIPETVLARRALVRAIAETEQLVETTRRPRALRRSVSEVEQVAEAIARRRALVRLLSEVEQIPETVRTLRGLLRVLSEVEQIPEARQTTRGLVRALNEVEQMPETVARVRGLVRAVAEVEQLSETVARRRALVRLLSEVEQIPETTRRSRAMVRALAEVAAIEETVTRRKVLVRVLSEVEQIPETRAGIRGLIRVLAEVEQVAEARQRTRGLVRSVSETVAVAETLAQRLVRLLVAVVGEAVAIAETSPRSRRLVRIASDAQALVEQLGRARSLVRTIVDQEAISEALARLRAMRRTLTETEQVGESTAATRALRRGVDETLQLVEQVNRRLVVLAAPLVGRRVPVLLASTAAPVCLASSAAPLVLGAAAAPVCLASSAAPVAMASPAAIVTLAGAAAQIQL